MSDFSVVHYLREVNKNSAELVRDSQRLIEIHRLTNYIAKAKITTSRIVRAIKDLHDGILMLETQIKEIDDEIVFGKSHDYPAFSISELVGIQGRLQGRLMGLRQTLSQAINEGFLNECSMYMLEEEQVKLLRK